MINAEQIRAARALLDWSTAELANQTGLTVNGINKIERGHVQPHADTREKLAEIFEDAGIEFLPSSGVRKQDNTVQIYEGVERFHAFTDFVYEHMSRHGGDICISAVNERLFRQYRKDFELYRQQMQELVSKGTVTVRILATESNFTSSWAQYRWQPEQSSVPTSFYAFGDCLALISFAHEPPPYVVLLKSRPFTEAYRHAFNIAWANAREPDKA